MMPAMTVPHHANDGPPTVYAGPRSRPGTLNFARDQFRVSCFDRGRTLDASPTSETKHETPNTKHYERFRRALTNELTHSTRNTKHRIAIAACDSDAASGTDRL